MRRRVGGRACETTGGRAGENTVGMCGGRVWASAGRRGSERVGTCTHRNKRGCVRTWHAGTAHAGAELYRQGERGGHLAGAYHEVQLNMGKSPMRSAMCMGTGRLAQV